MHNSSILVTGGTGYIGSHTAVELLNAGFDVIIVDNLYNSSADVIPNIEKITGKKVTFIKADCCDKQQMQHVFKTNNSIAAVIHFAAYKAVGESVEKPIEYYKNNLLSLLNVLEVMQDNRVNSFVFSSSCTVYGQPDKLPVTESSPIKPALSPYGNTKQISEEVLQDLVNVSNDFRCISLRYFNPIGAHPSALIGECPNGTPNNLVPLITQTAAGVRSCLNVDGNDYDTPDGSCIRDYIDVVDLAKAHVAAVLRLLDSTNMQRMEYFNIGTGKGISVFELIRYFEEATGTSLCYQVTKRRAGDIAKIWADPTLANSKLGWYAKKDIRETLLAAWKWQQQH